MNNKQIATELVKLAGKILDGAAIEHPRIKPQHNPPKEQRLQDLARINKALKVHKLQAEPSKYTDTIGLIPGDSPERVEVCKAVAAKLGFRIVRSNGEIKFRYPTSMTRG